MIASRDIVLLRFNVPLQFSDNMNQQIMQNHTKCYANVAKQDTVMATPNESCKSTKNASYLVQGYDKIFLSKFGEESSVRAYWLSIDCPGLMGGRKAGKSNMQEFFCFTLYFFVSLFG